MQLHGLKECCRPDWERGMNPTADQLRARGIGEATIRRTLAAQFQPTPMNPFPEKAANPGGSLEKSRGTAKSDSAGSRPSRLPHMSESEMQQALVRWFSFACIDFGLPDNALMAFPNQGKRTKANAGRMKAEGLRAGAPDVFLAVPSSLGHALFIEMKSPRGKLTASQKEMLAGLAHRGYATAVCHSTTAAQETIIAFLKRRETSV